MNKPCPCGCGWVWCPACEDFYPPESGHAMRVAREAGEKAEVVASVDRAAEALTKFLENELRRRRS